MSELAEFLLARITEDEEVARAAEHTDGPATLEWRRGGRWNLHFDNGVPRELRVRVRWRVGLVARDDGRVSDLIARWDPARVLAECEAKRRIVEMAQRFSSAPDDSGTDLILDDVLRLLALPYATHPDYRKEWAR